MILYGYLVVNNIAYNLQKSKRSSYRHIAYRFSLIQSKTNRFKPEDQICYDPNGNRIFGESSFGDDEINCRCSRKRWEMEQNVQSGDEKDEGFVISNMLC